MKMMRDIVNEMVGKGSAGGESGGGSDKMSELIEQCKACASEMGLSVDDLVGKLKSALSGQGDDDSEGEVEETADGDEESGEMSGQALGKDTKAPKKALIIAMLKKKSAKSSEY